MRPYAECSPSDVDRHLAEVPVAVVPWGALEWHGEHLPLGLDGLVAEGFARALAHTTGAWVLPTMWLPITTLPHVHSIPVPTEAVRAVFEAIVGRLHGMGAKVVCVVTGHYAQGHMVELTRAAKACCVRSGRTLFASPLEPLGDPALLDHAAQWEAAQLLALRPDLVWPERLPEGSVGARHAVLGSDPRLASAAEGEEVIQRAVGAWASWIGEALAQPPEALIDLYDQRLAAYDRYLTEFGDGDWDAALARWWAARLARETP